ncbi:MAG: right-handed parallel beta-helix repeat-containing protein, partial [Deltaproteobacteria bacterium]|nr:right-handed parallel beta-helix repeat-containing protein [Nannocystaceae bacterium]
MTRAEPIAVVALLMLVVPAVAHAAEVEVTPAEDLLAAVAALQPGDTLILREGTYELAARFGVDLVGTVELPIIIRAADGEAVHIHRAGTDQNIVDFDAAEYLTIAGIEFSGGSAGLRFSDARFVTLTGCEVHDTADVAVRANDVGIVYEGFHILRNEIHHTSGTGEGMYLGCNENGCQFTGALIEGNWVHDTNGAGVSQGDGIELKEGSSDNIVRDNVVHDTGYPCLLVYANAGSGGVNTLERNLLWNCGDHGIQAAADAVIRNNIILSSNSDGIAMQPHQSGAPANLVVVHNTVLHATNDAISVRDAVGSVTIANNALYAQQGDALFVGGDASMIAVVGNVGVGTVSGIDATLGAGDIATDFVAASYAGVPPIDVFPAPGGALIGSGDPGTVVEDDFNCTQRAGGTPDAGAYLADASGNPGWTLRAGFKECGGSGGDDGTTGDGGTVDDSSGGGPSEGADSGASDASAGEA